ncbi:MAG TPA: hypothetical protein VMR62_19820 [Bryobacteraceae bacterium]|jgi:hypothetical protein|nr:hypothetical protein [Bryobacteraceae bacterium]
MNLALLSTVLALVLCRICPAAHCTTVLNPVLLPEYEKYVAAMEEGAAARFDSGELAWVPANAAKDAAATLAAGKLVRSNISDGALNQRLAPQNGTVIHWIGAIVIRGVDLSGVRSVLEDYGRYDRIYRAIIFACTAHKAGDSPDPLYDVVLGMHTSYRFASIFLQHYAFRVEGKMEYSSLKVPDSGLRVRLAASEIRESDSGVPKRNDWLERYHDHGIMWALNAYWRARQRGRDVYLEFETITLARSVQEFACNFGFVPIPKSILYGAMDALPAESVGVVLDGTRAECERRAGPRREKAPGP